MIRSLYPEIEPFDTGYLDVSDRHQLYYERVGTRDGEPIVFLHGGPGGGLTPDYRRFFDPSRWNVLLFDQRGSGRSKPHAELEENTTWYLVSDIEKLREHFGVQAWTVFGGSWGSTLALAYAQKHPERVRALILRGIFLARDQDIDWFYKDGASRMFPEAWQAFLQPIPEPERGDLLNAYHRRLTSEDRAGREEAARAWAQWEGTTSRLYPRPEVVEAFGEERFAEALARIECHYFRNGSFLDSDTQLLDNTDRIADIPGIIVQGRYDVICPPSGAWALHQAWPSSEWVLVPDAGHASTEPGIAHALIEATDGFVKKLTG